MQNEDNGHATTYLGILECPLRSGYVEFEYHQGDTIHELKNKILKTWGTPSSLVFELDMLNSGRIRKSIIRSGFELTDRWAVFCEDSSGAFFAISNSTQIPIAPPAATIARESQLGWYYKHSIPPGAIHENDVPEGYGISNDRHLVLEIARTYEIPKDRVYSVRLLALVVIAGG